MRTIQQYYRLNPYKGDVGIEIEMEGDNLAYVNSKEWRCDNDGSLQAGIEYITREGVKKKDILRRLQSLKTEFAKQNTKLKPSVRCGVHIHLNVQECTHTQVINFAVLFYIFERLLVRWCGEKREGNLFCLRTDDADGVFDILRTALKEWNFKNLYNDNIRYAALNWKPLTQYGSLEIRCLQTPSEIMRIGAWAFILLNLLERAKEYESPEEIMGEFSMSTAKDFTTKHLGPFAERFSVDVDDLDTDLIAGMHNAQDLAFMCDWREMEKTFTTRKVWEQRLPHGPQDERWKVERGHMRPIHLDELEDMIDD